MAAAHAACAVRRSGALAATLLFALALRATGAAAQPMDGGLRRDVDAAAADATRADAGSSRAPLGLVPPRVLSSVPPIYPASHLGHGEHPTVVLKATILADGRVADVSIEHTAGADFDGAAIEAVKSWTFAPALRGEQPIASRIGIAVHFELPELAVLDVNAVTSAEPVVPHAHEQPAPHEGEAYVARAEVELERTEQRGANDYRFDRARIAAQPHAEAAELLRSAPGLVVTRIEGEAVGHHLMLRGFDAEHGQDIELTVDGVPINQPSHIHGQGYADLGFIIPETVHGLRVIEGVYDPAQGDFAIAGSADFQLGVEQRGLRLSSSYGAFSTFRELALWAPEGQPRETFAAATVRKTEGFGKNRAGTSGAVVAQGVLGSGRVRLVLHGSAYAARARTANVLRRDDIEAGRVGFYDVYPHPTAEAQHAASLRTQLAAKLRYLGESGAHGEVSLFALWNDSRQLANYTGFIERSRLNPSWAGRGDLIEQLNDTRTLGLRARHRGARWAPSPSFAGTLELGLAGRVDRVAQRQNLLEAPRNTTWDRRVDAEITAADLGLYVDLDLTVTEYLRLKGGVRADLLSYRVGDELQNFAPALRSPDYVVGYRRSAIGIAVGPRAVLEVVPFSALTLSAAYGEGYRSPSALLLDEGEPAPFTKVRSSDFGVRYAVPQASLSASGYLTKLGQDVVFEPTEGRTEPAGPSTRAGGVFAAEVRPYSWLRGSANLTYVRAKLDAPPPRTDEDPSPPFVRGQRLPYVPPWVLRVDASVERALASLARRRLLGRASLGYTFWSRRPLPYSEWSDAVSLLDGSLGLEYDRFSFDASLFNIAGSRYAALELSAASNWDPNAIPSRLPARHVMAGAPRTFLLTLGVRL